MKRAGLLLILIFLTRVCFAQESYLRHYATAEGLPGLETYSAFQDDKGYIWIASDMGVSRFDGYNFKVFTTVEGLTDNTVFNFYQDSKGRIWFYTFSGKLCYYYNDTIYGKDFAINDKIRDLLGSGYVTSIKADDHDTLFVSTSKGLLKIIPEINNGTVVWNQFKMLHNKRCYPVNNGYIIVERISNASISVERQVKGESVLKKDLPPGSANFGGVADLPNGSLLLFCEELSIEMDSSGNLKRFDSLKNVINCFRANDSTYWLSGKRKGVSIYENGNFSKPKGNFLTPLTVTGVLTDRESGYWFTTLEDGIFYMPSNKFTYSLKMEEHLLYPEIVMQVMAPGKIWVLEHNKIYANEGGAIAQTPLPVSKYTEHWEGGGLWNVFKSSSGQIWISTTKAIAVLDPILSGNIKYLLSAGDSRLVFETYKHELWGLNHFFIWKIDAQKKEIGKIFPLPSRAETACGDNNGNILIGTINGLYLMKNDSLSYLGDKNDIFKNRFVDLKNFNGKIAAATRGAGIIILAGDSIYHITTAEGLCSNMCRSIYVDDKDVIWVATNNGLSAVNFHEHPFGTQITNYSTYDGLLSNDISQVVKTGKLVWLLSQKGITSFDPELAVRNPVPPPVYITKVQVNNTFSSPEKIRSIDYGTNFMEIDFTGLTFKNAGKQRYKYQLLGYDTTAHYTQNTFVQFTKLPPGNYIFNVTCINNSGVASAAPAVFSFKVNTPFYKAMWFNIFMGLGAIFFIALISWLYIQRIEKREAAKTEMNLKIANYQLQALRAQMNPHFIFNCLNAIQDFILKNDSASAKYYLSSFSKLIRKTLDNSRKSDITLKEEIEFLRLYLNLEKMRFSDKFEYRLNISPEALNLNIEIPSMIMQPFIENAVRHGRIDSLDVKGQLNVDLWIEGNTLICKIEDNGIGINESLRLKSTGPQYRQSHAMDIMKERVHTINEVNQMNITYTTNDRSDIRPGETGTEVIVYIPFEKYNEG